MRDNDSALTKSREVEILDEYVGEGLPALFNTSSDYVQEAVRGILKQAQKNRLSMSEIDIEPADPRTGTLYVDEVDDIVGALFGDGEDATDPEPFSPAESPDFPMLQKAYQKFSSAAPSPKIVRLDTEESYAAFRDARRIPYLAAIERHLLALEQALVAHAADGHGEGHEDIAILQEDIDAHAKLALDGGTKIPLSLPPWDKSTECWQDGFEILVTMRALGPDGKRRMITTGTPVQKHVDEVIGYVTDAEIDPTAVMHVLPAVAQILGGGSLLPQLAAAKSALMQQSIACGGGPVAGKILPSNKPALAAVMSLCQACQKGSKQACAEVERLKKVKDGPAMIAAAMQAIDGARKQYLKGGQ